MSHSETINHIIIPSPIVDKNTMIGKILDDLLDRRARKGEMSKETGGTNKEKLSQYIEYLELALVIAGGIVVIGLIVEDGPELGHSLLTRTRPSRTALGDLLVTVGVFAEVLLAFVIARIARQFDAYAEADTARALERGAKAEETAALANERASHLESANIALRTELETAKAESAKAQLQLRQYIDHKAGPRRLNRDKFLELLRPAPPAKAIVYFKPEDVEAYQFAVSICRNLRTAGWEVLGPTTFALVGRGPRQPVVPSELSQGGAFGSGVTVRYREHSRELGENTTVEALCRALTEGREGGGDLEGVSDPSLRDGLFQIVIGQKK